MSKSKKKKKQDVKVYTIYETIHISYQVVATSEEDALDHYRNLPTDEFNQLLQEGASNNFCDDEIGDEVDYVEGDYIFTDKTDKAKEALR
jgi:hypothetical protein